VEAALKAIQKYYAFICRNRKLLDEIQPNKLIPVLHSGALLFQEQKFMGAQIAIFRINYWETNEISLRSLHQIIMYLMEHFTQQPEVQENGIYIIIDLAGFRFEHLWTFSSITEIRRTVEIVLVSRHF